MEAREQLITILTSHLLARGLRRVPGRLAFMHQGQTVEIETDQTVYRGYFVCVLDGPRRSREFRSGAAGFDWDAIAAAVVKVATSRLAPHNPGVKTSDLGALGALGAKSGADLWAALCANLSPKLSLEPSPINPGRVRVRVQDLDLDPATALQFSAAVSRALAPSL